MASDTEVYSPVCISDAVDPSDGRDDAASGRESLPIDQEYAPLEEAAVASSVDAVDAAASRVSDETVVSAVDDRQRQPQRPPEGAVDDSATVSSPPPPAFVDSCDAPPTTAAAEQHGHFAPSQQLPMTAAGYAPAGLQYPPFFANPFMTPYLPQATMGVVAQQPVDSAHQQLITAAPEQALGDPNFRMNPFTGGYFLAPSQYQEMMQQYLQSLLHAASYAPDPSAVSQNPASESARPTMDDVSNGLADFKLAQGTRPVPAQLPPYFQQMMPQMTFNAVPFPASVEEKRSGASSVEPPVSSSSSAASSAPVVDDHRRASVAKSENSSTVSQGNEPTPSSSAPSQPLSFASPATTIASSRGDSALTSLNNSPAKTSTPHDKLPHIEDGLSSQSESEVEVKSVPRPPDAENPTAVLIKKQMHEIEKEINRRIHNQNVKKIDQHEIEQLLSEQLKCEEELMRFYEQRMAATPQQNANGLKSALPWSGEASLSDVGAGAKQFHDAPDMRSMNELASAGGNGQSSLPQLSQRPHLPIVAPNLYQPHFPQAAMTTAAAMQQPAMLPPGTYPQQQMMMGQPPPGAHMSVFRPLPPSQSFVSQPPPMPMNYAGQLPPHYAAALLQQMQQEAASRRPLAFVDPTASPLVAPTPRMAHPATASVAQPPSDDPFRSEHGRGNGVWSPPAQERPHWTNGMAHEDEQTAFALNNNSPTKEQLEAGNGDDPPVWVMRDSYLKRMKRDEERAQQMERRLHEEALHNADKNVDSDTDVETDKLLLNNQQRPSSTEDENGKQNGGKPKKKEVMVHEPAVLIEGVLFRARYLGSTQLVCEGRPSKTTRMMQAQEAVARIKAPDGEPQPSTDVDLFISTEKIMVLNTDLQRISDTDVRQDILMDHALRTISYIADIGDVVVLMARRMSQSASQEECQDDGIRKTPRVICHVFESEEASFIAQSIGQAFQVAYVEFLRANGIDDPGYLREIDYQEVLNSQELMGEELEMFARKETQKDVVVPKAKGEPLGLVVVESGWGSMLPTVVIANLAPGGPASRCNLLNIGDQIIAINGISLVGLQLSTAQQNIKNSRSSTAVKLTVVHTPPVVEVRIKRPDTKYQLGFSVQNGVICSLLRGGIAERGGIRVGHRIIEINGQSVVAVAHEKIVNMLATAIGEIHMKTMPTSMFRLLTGQEVPNYI